MKNKPNILLKLKERKKAKEQQQQEEVQQPPPGVVFEEAPQELDVFTQARMNLRSFKDYFSQTNINAFDNYQIAVLESWKQMFIERVPIYISEKIKNDLENKRNDFINKYKKSNLNDNELNSSITKDIEQFFKDEIFLYVKDTIKAYYDVQIDIVSLNGGVLINNARYNFNQYDFNGNDFFNMNFDDILFKLLFTIIGFISPIGITLAIAGAIFGGMIKETMREKSINELIDKFKNQIVGKDYILNIKNAIIKCLEETDKKLSEYFKINIKE